MTSRHGSGIALALLAVAAVGACSDSAGPVGPGSPGDPGTAVLGQGGGVVIAGLAGGGELALSIPAGALSDTVTITITPVTPTGGEYAAFTFSPAGLEFLVPAVFSATLGSDVAIDADAAVTFDLSGVAVPSPSDVDLAGRRVSTTIRHLGWAAGAAPVAGDGPRRSSASAGGGSGAVASQNYLARVAVLTEIATAMQGSGSFANAEAFLQVLESIVESYASEAATDAAIPPSLAEMRRVACGQYDFALSDLGSYTDAGGIPGLVERIRQVIRWGEVVGSFGELAAAIGQSGCPAPVTDPVQAVKDKLDAFLPQVEEEIELFTVTDSAGFEGVVRDRLLQLLNLSANLQLVPALIPVSDAVVSFVSGQFTRLRTTAYATCSATGAQQMHRFLVRTEIGFVDAEAASPYSLSDIATDAQLCGLGVKWRTVGGGGGTLRSDSLGGGVQFGATVRDTLTIASQQSLELTGPARSLSCPAGGGDGGGLEVRVLTGGNPPATIATRPAGDTPYLAQAVSVQGAALRTQAGMSPGEIGFVVIELRRTGDFCGLDFALTAHSETLQLEARLADGVEITTTGLAGGTVGVGYSQTLLATGSTGAYTWNIVSGALPAGLSLAGTTGVISGTPAMEGTSAFTVQVRSGSDSATRALSIVVEAPPIAPLVITTTFLPVGQVGVPYVAALAATGGFGARTWSVTGGLPAGLQASAAGAITGTPTAPDLVGLTISVTDGVRSDATVLALRIDGSPLQIVTDFIGVTLPDLRFIPFLPLDVQLLAGGGAGGPYTWTLVSGSLPVGATMNSSGRITGNVTNGGSPTITVRVSDGTDQVEKQIEVRYVCCFF